MDRSSRKDVRRRNTPDQWVISTEIAHASLVSEEDLIAVQKIRTAPKPRDGSKCTYQLGGLIRCGICGRKLDSHWANGHPGYRCRHGQTSAKPATGRPPFLYAREDKILVQLNTLAARHGLADASAVITRITTGEYVLYHGRDGVRLEAITGTSLS